MQMPSLWFWQQSRATNQSSCKSWNKETKIYVSPECHWSFAVYSDKLISARGWHCQIGLGIELQIQFCHPTLLLCNHWIALLSNLWHFTQLTKCLAFRVQSSILSIWKPWVEWTRLRHATIKRGGNSVNNQLSFAGVNLIERDKAKGRTCIL